MNRLSKSRGQAIVEFSLVLLVFLMGLYGLIASGIWTMEASAVNGALNADVLQLIAHNPSPPTQSALDVDLQAANVRLATVLFDTNIMSPRNSCPFLMPGVMPAALSALPPPGNAYICVSYNPIVYSTGLPLFGYVEMGIFARPGGFGLPFSEFASMPISDVVVVRQMGYMP